MQSNIVPGLLLREGTGREEEGRARTFINLVVHLPRVLLIYVASTRDARAEHLLACACRWGVGPSSHCAMQPSIKRSAGCRRNSKRDATAGRTSKGLGHRAAAQLTSDGDDLTERNGSTVLDVLHLLAVTRGLLQRAQHEGGGAGAHVDGGVAVLAGELAGDRQALPVLGCLLDIITDLLG